MADEPIHPDLVKIALDRVTGWQFEGFANSFYASLVGVRFVPLGGNKDGGADAFDGDPVKQEEGRPTIFFQASIEADYRSKLRRTVKRLREFGRDPRELTYLTSRTVKYIDAEERELSRELDVTIRIRDAAYAISHINDGSATRAAYRHYLQSATDFLKSVGASSIIGPSRHVSSPAVYVFLEQELARRRGDTSLVDAVTDSLILWALEGTDPDAGLFMSQSDILERISREIPATRQVVEPRLERRLQLLASRNHPDGRQVRWHKKDDLYVLPYETRRRIEDENRADESLRLDVLNSLYSRIAAHSHPSLSEVENRVAAEVALRSLQRTFEQEGLEFSSFLLDEAQGDLATVTDSIRTTLTERNLTGQKGLAVGEVVFQAIRSVFYESAEIERAYLGKLSRTYTLLFTLNTEPKLIEFFQDVTGHLNLYVGTDLLVRALSERYVPEPDQMTRRTLLMASRLGARLVLSDAVLEEVLGNLRAADHEFRNWFESIEAHVDDHTARNADKIMIRAYFYAKLNPNLGIMRPTSWPAFVSQFCRFEDLHRSSAVDNLRRYLQVTFGLEHESDDDLETIVNHNQLNELTTNLAESKATERLARNDALMALAVYARRRQRREDSSVSEFGYETWWLTSESTILRHTKELVRSHRGARYMMRPDFLLNFLTLAPNSFEARQTLGHVFPSLLGIRLSRRMKESTYHGILSKVKEAASFEDARRAAAIADATNRLKGDFWKQYRVQLQEDRPDPLRNGSSLVMSTESSGF
ncbi:hypothetical protein SAMN05660209_01740 [Geodermatophilus africanus]|uniref:Uncharacterized protein n=1 Tax=Geodermatophilus africanus TaxID=1137993 RepID=A0A1H3G710_9ACTN|nr:hypothetical protein [Geodermatophilus africanus]SDX98418.1 hypothetical protein SAMN05660209_01740 [Geodermatophilus africanus]